MPRDVASVVTDGAALVAYLLRLPDGQPVALEGSSALIWLAADSGVDDVAAQVAEWADQPRDEIIEDVETFLDALVGLGLLEVLDEH